MRRKVKNDNKKYFFIYKNIPLSPKIPLKNKRGNRLSARLGITSGKPIRQFGQFAFSGIMDIIDKLNRLRLERNMSVYRLAELSDINQSTLANTFSRGTVPSIHTLEAVCSAMGFTLAQFFSEDEAVVRLTPEEARFFENYKRLPPDIKKSINDIVSAFVSGQKE